MPTRRSYLRLFSLLLAAVCLSACFGCVKEQAQDTALTVQLTATEDEKFGGAVLSVGQEAFENFGFQMGDSVDITFGDGFVLSDVPYFNGYYVKVGAPVCVAYPGAENVVVNYNCGVLWSAIGLSGTVPVTVTLRQASKYSYTFEALGQDYSTDYTVYGSEEAFCNFRPLSGGNLKPGLLYRGASPVDNARLRAAHTDRLIEEQGVQFIVDLADSEENIAAYMASEDFDSPYAADLYSRGQIALLDMDAAYQSEDFKIRLAEGMREMTQSTGPVYIHCQEGKDRTGYVCILLEALAGATYEELKNDYMQTYANYYGITLDDTPEKYTAVIGTYFEPFVGYLHGTEDTEISKEASFIDDAANYFMAGGMTVEEVDMLKAFICGE